MKKDFKVSIEPKDGVGIKYYNVPLTLEQLAWLIQKQTPPELALEDDNEENEVKKLDFLIGAINEVNQNSKSIINTMNCVVGMKDQQETIQSGLTKLNDLVRALPNSQSLEIVTSTIRLIKELQEKLTNSFSQLSDSISDTMTQFQNMAQSERLDQPVLKTEESSTDYSNTLNNISFNIDQLSRKLNEITVNSPAGDELNIESVYRRQMYKLVDMPVKLYERTSKRLFEKKENNPDYDGKELELVLNFLRRHLDSIGLSVCISERGTAFDASTMEVDDEHAPIPINTLGQEHNTVAYTILPRLVWRASSGLPESMLNPEKIILYE